MDDAIHELFELQKQRKAFLGAERRVSGVALVSAAIGSLRSASIDARMVELARHLPSYSWAELIDGGIERALIVVAEHESCSGNSTFEADPAATQRPSSAVVAADHEADSDSIGRFLSDCTRRLQGARVQSTKLHVAYIAWAKVNNEFEYGIARFGAILKSRGFRVLHSSCNYWLDLDLTVAFAERLELAAEIDVIRKFREACVAPSLGCSVRSRAAFNAFSAWCRANGLPLTTETRFGIEMKNHIRWASGAGRRGYYVGINIECRS